MKKPKPMSHISTSLMELWKRGLKQAALQAGSENPDDSSFSPSESAVEPKKSYSSDEHNVPVEDARPPQEEPLESPRPPQDSQTPQNPLQRAVRAQRPRATLGSVGMAMMCA